MIVGLGIDICAVGRIERLARRYDNRFLDRVFTAAEIRHCAGEGARSQRLAARFAAKEATMKALGTGWARGVRFVDIEVTHDAVGRPVVSLSGGAAEHARRLGVDAIHVSLSHEREQAVAIVVMESGRS